jgi:glycosyltransferase involved in cell wall biosynthesis
MRIAYVVSEYPLPSHTFIHDEVRGLRALGAHVETFSVRRTAAGQLLSDADRELASETYAIRPPRPHHFALAHLRALANSPRRYLDTLRRSMALAGPGVRSAVWRLMYFVQAVVVWDRCRRRGIRHLHAHFANVASDIAMLAAMLGEGWSWSFTMHGPTEFFEVEAHRLAEKTSDAALVACISDYCRSQLMAFSGPENWEKLRVVHCGVDTERFSPPKAQGDGGLPRIVQVGRLVPVKGQSVLLAAAATLRDRGHEFRLELVGDGPDRAELTELAHRLELADRTMFHGALSHDQVRDVLAGASVMCLPSFAEGVPVVLMEAMAMEVPVLSSRIMGIPELVEDGHCGALVAPGDADSLAGALERLLEDPQQRAQLGRRGRERIREAYDRPACTRELFGLFSALPAAVG